MSLALGVMAYLLSVGPTAFLLRSFVTSFGDYVTQLVPLSFPLYPFHGSEVSGWFRSWTLTYLIWWIAWALSWAFSSRASAAGAGNVRAGRTSRTSGISPHRKAVRASRCPRTMRRAPGDGLYALSRRYGFALDRGGPMVIPGAPERVSAVPTGAADAAIIRDFEYDLASLGLDTFSMQLLLAGAAPPTGYGLRSGGPASAIPTVGQPLSLEQAEALARASATAERPDPVLQSVWERASRRDEADRGLAADALDTALNLAVFAFVFWLLVILIRRGRIRPADRTANE
ncbi:MAG: hypothetical protein GWN84_11905 [Gammaproteobacteria bacterium]|nr:hypothetical protein [Gammaproteobacteria bacterium]NIR83572.1 hypothetical protein [Gammaproteobacteria bacterium]NIR91494.1 hypothetical protein [Gammaproteobacteria bacterium]NIU04734.1 hypothetical protein [Gammaproteobacteria bacterium]NIV51776.1 hypothetical protein [Gammaproteobacteria bacterium]